MTRDYVLDGQVEETLLDLARRYEDRLAAIEQAAAVTGGDHPVELVAD